MYMLDLEKSEEPDIKLPISLETQKKQGNSRKTSIFASLSALKTLIVWITTSQKNSWKFLETGIQDHHICPLRNLYTGQQATVRNIHRTRDHFKTGKRVCQGNKLSPCLFNIGAGYIILYSGWSTTWTQDSVQLSSVPQSTIRVGAPTLWDPTHGSTPGFPVYQQLPELVQMHVHQVWDAIKLFHPQSSPSPPTINHSQHQGLL